MPAVARIAKRMRLVSDLARDFAGATEDYDRLLALVAKRLGDTFGDLALIRLISDDGQFLGSTGAMHHPDPKILELARSAISTPPQRVGEGITGIVAETGRSILVPAIDVSAHLGSLAPDRREYVEAQGIRSIVCAPLQARGKVIGVLSLTRSHSDIPYTEDDLHLLEDVAGHASLAIENARAYAAERSVNEALALAVDAQRLLFEANPLPVVVFDVQSLGVLAVNDAALHLYGYTREDFAATGVGVLTEGGDAVVRQRVAEMGEREISGTREHRTKRGVPFLAEFVTRALVFNGKRARMTVIRDVTDRDAAERVRARLAAIVESSTDPILSTDATGVLTSWNAAAERVFGHPAAEVVGRPIDVIIPSDKIEEQRQLLARVAKGESIDSFETEHVKRDGTRVPVSLSIAPIRDASGVVAGASRTLRDLTAQKKAADELRRTEHQLVHSQKMDAIGRLAGGIAHDFNNLLSVIMSYSEIARVNALKNEALDEALAEIAGAAARAAELTQQLLLFSRQDVAAPRIVDLNEMIEKMRRMLHRILGEDIDLASAPGADIGRIRATPSHVEQVIMNLVVNARDAMPRGGTLSIETRNVELGASYVNEHLGVKAGSYVMLAVTDTGVGMDEATKGRIFEPFFTTKPAGKGTGLGLATVFAIVERSGGSVWVYSELGRGTTFKIYFPRVDEPVERAPLSTRSADMGGHETILLVEDQAQVRAVAAKILSRSGYTVLATANAAEALEHVAVRRDRIDMLLTDVVMPQMSGPELAQRVTELRPHIKVLFMSGYTDDSVVRHGVLERTMAFVEKPFTPDSLLAAVREALGPRDAAAKPTS